jgi:hypothetical protein
LEFLLGDEAVHGFLEELLGDEFVTHGGGGTRDSAAATVSRGGLWLHRGARDGI